ncbi:DUF2971 domain-containing protein [Pontiellaceae bacterium B12227]|nr:DUF2971 domain-containing protein [Pontiellaceae bacterium B12227]
MIYRYIGFETDKESKLQTLFNNELWFSSPQKFNDPFDCHFHVQDKFSRETFEKFAGNTSKLSGKDASSDIAMFNSLAGQDESVSISGLMEQLQHHIDAHGICCFSKLWNSILMWSHYADKHTGICIGYDDTRDNGELCEVKYSTHYPELHVNETDTCDGLQTFKEKYLLTKSADWIYENEYRLIDPIKCNFRDPSPFPIVNITFGIKMGSKLKQDILNHFGDDVMFYSAIHKATGRYGLSRFPIT